MSFENHTENAILENKIVNKRKKSRRTKENNEGDDVDTSNFTIEERLVAAVWVHERKLEKISMSQIKDNFEIRFSKAPPTKNTLYFWEKKIFATGRVADVKRPGRPCKRKSLIPTVEASLKQAPGLSIRSRAQQLSLSTTTLRKILVEDIKSQSPDYSSKTNEPELATANVQPVLKQTKDTVPKCNLDQQPINLQNHNNIHPPHSYTYAETFGSLPLSAFQHFLTYPNNGHQCPTMVHTHSKMPIDTQNHINMNVGSHIHQHHHNHAIVHHNYVPNNQMQEATIITYPQNGEYINGEGKSNTNNIPFVTANFLKQ